jgi:hypothetical protein
MATATETPKRPSHELVQTYYNAWDQRTDVCTCGAAVDNIDDHLIFEANLAKQRADRAAALEAARQL